jgi:hypothetical protein
LKEGRIFGEEEDRRGLGRREEEEGEEINILIEYK